MTLRNYQGAIADYTKVIQLSPSANAYSDRGFALAALSKYREAIADYDRAISLVPKHYTAHYGRGLARVNLGDKKGALSDLQRAESNYREGMGEGNLDQPLYQQIIRAIEQLQQQ
ncbi:tetratricopeptide repeat protein [Calothrix sp. PCC 7507]|uniref:tetratricopeptide repeat protein n=1 Tax=Calothrix sp. PCC 7507 TaxID=99598 RepID=UPI000A05D712